MVAAGPSVADPRRPDRPILKGSSGAGAVLPSQTAPSDAAKDPVSCWNTTSTNALKSALNNARNPTLGPRPKSVMLAMPLPPSDVASRLDNVSITTHKKQHWRAEKAYDPSMGPTPSAITTRYLTSTAASNNTGRTGRTGRHTFQNAVCKLSNFTRSDFRPGDVIAAPFHTANTNPNVDPSDPRLVRTVEGHVYSKRRMLVVLFIHSQDLYCLPLFSFGNRGIKAKPEALQKEYVCMRNFEDVGFQNPGVHAPVVITSRRPITESTTVHLTGGIRVGCNEDITIVGKLTDDSYLDLVEIWQGLIKEARRANR